VTAAASKAAEQACRLAGRLTLWRDLDARAVTGAEGSLLSFAGKLPGMAARLALVLAALDWATEGGAELGDVTAAQFGRAAHLAEAYLLPMARRAYAGASGPKPERAARRLLALLGKQGWTTFTARQALRLDRAGLSAAATGGSPPACPSRAPAGAGSPDASRVTHTSYACICLPVQGTETHLRRF
jgi:hypothetical protein